MEKEIIQMKTEEKLKINSTLKCEYCGKEYKYHEKKSRFGYKGFFPICDCFKKREEISNRKKEGIELKSAIKRIKYCGIGERFKNKTFSNFDKSKNINPYNICYDYAKNIKKYIENGKGLFLTGNVGTGKTHLVVAIIDYIARMFKGRFKDVTYREGIINRVISGAVIYRITFTTAIDMLSKIKFSFNRKYKEDKTTEEIIEKFKDCELLIIDDLGPEKATEWVQEIFYSIIDYRYRELKPTIITTNLTDIEIKEKLSERLISRIYEMCKGVKFKGKDYRISK